MSIQASTSSASANAFGLPTTSTPARQKRSARGNRHSTRPLKKQRMQPANEVIEEESDYESNDTKSKDNVKSHGGIVALLSDILSFFKLDSNPPSSSSSSSSSTSKSASKGNLRDSQDAQPTYVEASETVDLTLEPDDDIAFPSPPNIPKALPPTSSQSSHTMKASSSGSRRRDPLYNEIAKLRGKNRRERKLLDMGGTDLQLWKHPQASNQSSIYSDASLMSVSSPTYNGTANSSTYSFADSSRTLTQASSGFNGNPMGLENYRKTLFNRVAYGDGSSARTLIAPYKTPDRDILVQQRTAPQPHGDNLGRALAIAQDSLNTPRPKETRLTAYRKSQLRDEELSEKIDNINRRRRIWPDAIPPENEKIIAAVLRTPGVIASLPSAEVSNKDIVKLRPGEWLNDEVINFYGVMVNIRSSSAKARRDKGFAEPGDENLLDVHVFNSFFFQKLTDNGYSSVRRWTKKFDLFKKDIIIMPVNLGNMHWVCAAINIEKQRFEYYDSMGKINYNVLNKLREYVQEEHKDKKKAPIDLSDWTDYSNPKTPQQANGYDCGVFTSQFIECLSRRDGQFDFEQRNMPYLRRKMIHEIKQMQIAPEQWYDPNAN